MLEVVVGARTLPVCPSRWVLRIDAARAVVGGVGGSRRGVARAMSSAGQSDRVDDDMSPRLTGLALGVVLPLSLLPCHPRYR
jgi:hypothetical protein